MLPLVVWSLFSNQMPSAASETASESSLAPVVTDRVYLDLRFQAVKQSRQSNEQVDDQAPIDGRIVIGLYGNDAPETAAFFKELFAGRLITPCQPFEEDPSLPARAQLGKRKMDRMCQASAAKPISLEGSQVRPAERQLLSRHQHRPLHHHPPLLCAGLLSIGAVRRPSSPNPSSTAS